MAEASWYYVDQGRAVGPVTFDQLRELARSNRLAANDLVCAEGGSAWQAAFSVAGLFGTVTPPVPPVPPSDTLDQLAAANRGGGYGPGPLPYGGYPGAGYAYQGHYSGARMGQSQQGLAIAGFVCAFLIPLLGLIFSCVALSGMSRNRNDEGKGLATAGLVISIVYMGVACVWFTLAATFVSRW
ncbi:MAG TPA: GYF domain-containing protein [Tepidisphaeraceae bacterium]|nr:GYF domain-containing protein [Tepidisphaeraceae bacterium]